MGSTSWSDEFYTQKVQMRATKGITASNSYTTQVRNTTPPEKVKVHKNLNPYGVTMRESRDSDAHPNSNAIAVIFDVTGSMEQVPVVLQKKLNGLMALLLKNNWIDDPQIMCAAVGDANSDRVPLQIGQFESGVEIDNDLDAIYLEGRGGAQRHETYELAAYFLARHTSIDCYEKRGKKGYVIFIGDEMPYEELKPHQINNIIGDEVKEVITTAQVFEELKEKYNVICLMPTGTQYENNQEHKKEWQKYLGHENVMTLEDPNAVCEAIALYIGMSEGRTDIHGGANALSDAGMNKKSVSAATTALSTYNGKSLTKTNLPKTKDNLSIMSL